MEMSKKKTPIVAIKYKGKNAAQINAFKPDHQF